MTREEAFQIFLDESKKKLQDPRMTWEVLIASAFNTAWEVAKEDTVCKAWAWVETTLYPEGTRNMGLWERDFRKAMED